MDIEKAVAFYRELRKFTPPGKVYRHPNRFLAYTEGVKFAAETLAAHWLIDRIAGLQPLALRFAGEFQLWELFVKDDRSTSLVCSRDSEDSVFRLRIPSTDFPLDYLRLYVEGGVLMLPSEH